MRKESPNPLLIPEVTKLVAIQTRHNHIRQFVGSALTFGPYMIDRCLVEVDQAAAPMAGHGQRQLAVVNLLPQLFLEPSVFAPSAHCNRCTPAKEAR
jgi:hypothetical protein